jgi:hypothetical protein
MKHRALIPALLWLTASLGCGSTSSSTDIAPSPVRCNATGAPERSTFAAGGGTANLVVTAARECSWSVTSDAPWITLSAAQGTGDGQVRYTVARNSAGSDRRGRLALGAQTYEVTQQAAACRLDVSRQTFDAGPDQQTFDLTVDATAGCSWTANSSSNWIAVTEGSQGSGDGRVRFRVSANAGAAPRSGTLEVAGIRIEVRQAGAAPKCPLSVDPNSAQAGPEGMEDRLTVRTDEGCSWTASSDQPWLTIVSGESGAGTGEVRYRATPNTGTASRAGHIAVQGVLFTLQQDACQFALSRTSASHDARSGVGAVEVATSSVCKWSAVSRASWIVVTDGASGSGDGRVEYLVRANTTSATRTGTITIAGQPFTITQLAGFTIEGRAQDVEGSCPTKRFTVRGQDVRTTSATLFQGGSCSGLREGTYVRVSGIIGADSVMTATEIEL